jgi:ClpP class serine protease
MDKVGLAPVTYKSGKFKDMLSGDRSTNEIPAEEHAMVQALIDETYGKFTNVVCSGRTGAQEKQQGRPGARLQLDQFCRRPRAVRLRGAQVWLRGRTRRF